VVLHKVRKLTANIILLEKGEENVIRGLKVGDSFIRILLVGSRIKEVTGPPEIIPLDIAPRFCQMLVRCGDVRPVYTR
jgi:hypothetical protein